MSRTERIRQRLKDALDPEVLEVVDDSESHRGHAGFQEGGESHFNVRIKSQAFVGLSRIARHRKVHSAIGCELMAEIHALSLDLEV